MLGFAGPSRSGKTTLGNKLSEKLGVPFTPFSGTKALMDAGIPLVGDMRPSERLYAQRTLLDMMVKQIETAPRPCIIDRTPLDIAAYMLAEVPMYSPDLDLGRQIDAFVQECIRATRRHFDAIMLVGALPFYEVAEGKPMPNLAYQRHVQAIIFGLTAEIGPGVAICTSDQHDLNLRLAGYGGFIEARLEQLRGLRMIATIH
jgi:hypothetical protein